VILAGDSIFMVCRAVSPTEQGLFSAYEIRACIRPGFVLTVHGGATSNPQPLQRRLSGLDCAIDGGTRHFACTLLREVTSSYVRVLDALIEKVQPLIDQRGKHVPALEARVRRVVSFLRLLRRHRSLCEHLKQVAPRLLEDGNNLIDELMIETNLMEIRTRELVNACKSQASKPRKEQAKSAKERMCHDRRRST
jgi:Mg2+ and Co2+ transporter CorA